MSVTIFVLSRDIFIIHVLQKETSAYKYTILISDVINDMDLIFISGIESYQWSLAEKKCSKILKYHA